MRRARSGPDLGLAARTTAALAAVLAVGAVALPALAQAPSPSPTEEPVGSVSLLPRDIDPDAPHNGTWFVLTAEPGEVVRATATLANPTSQDLVVSLRLLGLAFDVDGTPELQEAGEGLGAWGAFAEEQVQIAAGDTAEVAFAITVPSGTPPGDHLGAAVAETRHPTDEADLVQRVATRVIVTVPGDADRAFELDRVTVEPRPGPVPRGVVVRVQLRNTGSIRLAPVVTVAGVTARGPRAVVRNSTEEYVAEVPSGPLGGWLDLPVVADDVSGVTRRADTGAFLMPWWLVVLGVAVGGGALVLGRRRGSRRDLANLRADVRRLERLVLDGNRTPRDDGQASAALAHGRDPQYALESALKRARRAQEHEAFAELALAFHEAGRDALGYLIDALANPTDRTDELVDAAASYGRRAMTTRARRLPEDVQDRLLERLRDDGARAGGDGSSGASA